jgi:hypothetical protein
VYPWQTRYAFRFVIWLFYFHAFIQLQLVILHTNASVQIFVIADIMYIQGLKNTPESSKYLAMTMEMYFTLLDDPG